MSFTKEIIDFNGKTDSEIVDILQKNNIPLLPSEIKMIQNDFLGRPPSLAECVLFSIEASELCCYKTCRIHVKEVITDGNYVVLGDNDVYVEFGIVQEIPVGVLEHATEPR